MKATIQKWGNSQGIRVPKAILEAVGIEENESVELELLKDGIIIKKIEKNITLTLNEIFEG